MNLKRKCFSFLWRPNCCFGKSLIPLIMILFIVFLILLLLMVLLIPNVGAHISYFMLGRALFRDCTFIKGPMVQIIGDSKAMLVWETCQNVPSVKFIWNNGKEQTIQGTTLQFNNGNRANLFKTFIDDYLLGSCYIMYEIIPSRTTISSPRRFKLKMPSMNKTEPLRIAVLGDNQMGYKSFDSLLSSIRKAEPNLFLHVGDMVQTPYKDYDWQTYFFDPLRHSGLLSQVPFVIAQGNHDVYDGQISPYFAPLNRLKGEPTGYYHASTIGGIVRLIVLDSNTKDNAQLSWLERELQSEDSRNASFRIVAVHIPPFIEFWDPVSWKRGEWRWPIYLRDNIVPLFEEYGVDLVLSGHQHNYQRGIRHGVVYVISGGGGGSLDNERVENYNIYTKTFIEHHYTLLDISLDQIKLTMKLIDGRIGDTLIINKKPTE